MVNTDILSAAETQRPRLFIQAQDIGALRKKFADPQFSDYREVILREADRLIMYDGDGKFEGKATPKLRAYKLAAQRKQPVLNLLPWAYVLTDDVRYRNVFLSVMEYDLERVAKGELLFDPAEHGSEFKMVQFAVHMAAAYDLLYEELDATERKRFEKYLDQSLANYSGREKPTYGWKNNIGAIYFASTAIVAMSRLDGNPEAEKILEDCLTKIKEFFYTSSILPHEDGGYPEGALYRNFALLWTIALVDVYERVTGRDDHGLLEPPFFRNSFRYMETMMGGDGVWFTYNDSQPQWYGAPSAAWLGARYNQPLMLWMADYLVENYNREDINTRSRGLQPTYWVMSFLWRDTTPAPEEPPSLPTLAILPSLGIGTIRSEGKIRPPLQVTVRGRGPAESGHNQTDTGSFVLYAGGENFLLDPGYFLSDPLDHSLLTVDGVMPQKSAPAPVTGGEQGDLRWLVLDATADYQPRSGGPDRVRRTFTLIGNDAVVVIDDVTGDKATTHLQSAFAADIDTDGQSAILKSKSGNRLWLKSFGSDSMKWSVEGPRDFGKSWMFRIFAEEGRIAWHTLKATFAPRGAQPLVTVFIPFHDGAATPKARVDEEDGTLSVTVNDNRTVTFQLGESGWRPAGETD